jgi:hypothetical protein
VDGSSIAGSPGCPPVIAARHCEPNSGWPKVPRMDLMLLVPPSDPPDAFREADKKPGQPRYR